ncbi:PLP-dependent decarboxylase [bacterium]|nr:PLP-dependent decarboxylase [bacterium]
MNPFEGETSFFLYDLDRLSERVRELKFSLASHAKLFYAVKANALSSIINVVAAEGIAFDFASSGELSQLKKSAISFENCIATGPAKNKLYLSKLLDNDCGTIVLESINQLKWLNELCLERECRCDVLLRIQLDWRDSTEQSVLGGNLITPFGLHPSDWAKISLKDFSCLDVLGVHCFQWGNILKPEQLEKVWMATAEASQNFSKQMGFSLTVLDLGGGLGVDYVGSSELKVEDVKKLLIQIKEKFSIPEVWMELGRFLVADCGKFYSRVCDLKTVRSQNVAVLESGINHLARSALTGVGFPAQVYGSQTTDSLTEARYKLVGPLCTSLDVLGEQALLGAKVGCWIEFSKVGAYGFSESMPYFLGHDLPGEFVLQDGAIRAIRSYLSAEDYLR